MTKVKAAIFASGTGSNFQALMEQPVRSYDVVLLVCDRPGAAVLEKAATYNVPTFVFDPKEYDSKITYEQKLVEKLREVGVAWIFLAGYMRMIGTTLLQAFEGKTINVHPSLLPEFPGKDAIGQASDSGVKRTGVTIHFIDQGMDTGPIIAQKKLDILPDDTKDTLQKRIQAIEHVLYPQVIEEVIRETNINHGHSKPNSP